MKFAVIALLGNISAITVQREPLLSAGASTLEVHQIRKNPEFNMNYKVPNFGPSHEIQYTQDSI